MMSTTGDIFATEEDQIGWVEPGFELTVLDGFRFEMAQPLTGFRQTYDVSGMDGELRKIFYREDGEVNENHPLYYEYFQKDIPYPNGNRAYEYLSFEPVDCDGDGVYEIAVGKQFILDIQLTITIGEEVLLLAYNPDTEAFDIQKADFDMQLGNPDGTLAPDWYRMEKASS